LVVLCSLAFLWQLSLGGEDGQRMIFSLGTIPAVLFGHNELAPELILVPAEITLLTSMFLHGGWMHLIGNMLFLWVLGDNIEDAMGHKRFIVFYILCGVAAALAHGLVDPQSQSPMIGASGAISGVIGAYLLLHPKAHIHTLVFYFVIAIPAWIVLCIWIGIQVSNVVMGGDGNVAWWAHLGGLAAGLILIPLFKNKDVALLNDVIGVTKEQAELARVRPRGIRLMRVVPKSSKNSEHQGPWQ
jgi:membrane associated rhomboid family serine protease